MWGGVAKGDSLVKRRLTHETRFLTLLSTLETKIYRSGTAFPGWRQKPFAVAWVATDLLAGLEFGTIA
jgi:hypothetical protein